MPNWPQPNDFKLVWVQYHIVQGPAIGLDPVIGGSAMNTAGQTILASPWGTPTPVPPGGGVGGQGLRFPFNPNDELITLTNPNPFPMVLDWLQINTICAPSPGVAVLVGMGGLVAAGRRRRTSM